MGPAIVIMIKYSPEKSYPNREGSGMSILKKVIVCLSRRCRYLSRCKIPTALEVVKANRQELCSVYDPPKYVLFDLP